MAFKTFDSAAQAKRDLRSAIENVAARTICRKCHVHPEVLTSYPDGNFVLEIKSAVESELRDEFAASSRRRRRLSHRHRAAHHRCAGVQNRRLSHLGNGTLLSVRPSLG